MKKISYYLVFIVTAGVILVSFWGYQKYFKQEVAELLLFEVERGNIQEVVKVRGDVVSQKELDLEFPFSGTVEKIYVQEGERVDQNDYLMKLETTDFELERLKLRAQLAQAEADVQSANSQLFQYQASLLGQQAVLDELKSGTRVEEIQIAETKVENAKKALTDAETNLDNVKNKAETDIQKKYDNAITVTAQSIIVGTQAIFTLTDIQYDYFQSVNDSSQVSRAKATAVYALLGGTGGGQWTNQYINELVGGAKGTVLNAETDPTLENIDQALQEVLDALQKVKAALDAVPIKSTFTSTDKTKLNTEKTNVSDELITISDHRQAIEVQKATNQNNISTAEAGVNDAKNALATAEDELFLKKSGSTKHQIAAQDAQVKQAEAQIESQKANIKQTEAQVASVDAEIKLIQHKINKSILYASDSTKVVKIWLEEKELFRPGQPAISLFASGYKVQADLSELDIGKIREVDGNDVNIQLDSFPGQEFKGKIMSIDSKEIIKDGDSYYRINVDLEDYEESIRSGMSADLIIYISFKENVLKIPEFIIYEEDDKKFVKILRGGSTEEVEIETGISDGESIEIITGLSEGQTVVISN